MYNIENGDCLELMKKLPDKSVDLFICDLPYAETNCKWDIAIDMEQFWKEFKRLRKSKRTACIHFCSTKFGYQLIKSWEKGFKMDMVWKKRNKTGGLQSRHRPMRNHEMVYFFYDQSPKYNRDKYHKRIEAKPAIVEEDDKEYKKYDSKVNGHKYGKKEHGAIYNPPNPASVVEGGCIGNQLGSKSHTDKMKKNGEKSLIGKPRFETPQPASVLEEETEPPDQVYSKKGWQKGKQANSKEFRDYMKEKGLELKYEPVNPASVLEETDNDKIVTDGNRFWSKVAFKGSVKETMNDYKNRMGSLFEPANPASVLEEEKPARKSIKDRKGMGEPTGLYSKENQTVSNFEPPNPASVLEEYIEPAEDEPWSMFESTKVFIGKRNHQTEKPIDILEFFLKYWTNDGDTILDPTMGSGSTGVACNNIGNRTFIGFEMNETIFEVAKKRCEESVNCL